jgi:hypothetical protein
MGKLDCLKGKPTTAILHETVPTTQRTCRRPLESVTSTVLNSDGIHTIQTESISLREYPAANPGSSSSRPPKDPEYLDNLSTNATDTDFHADEDEREMCTDGSLPTGMRRLHQVRTCLLFAVSYLTWNAEKKSS